MHQVGCPSCGATFEYQPDDYVHLCNSCSAGFILDLEEGVKDIIDDHYVAPNRVDRDTIEKKFHDWLGKSFHKPVKNSKEIKIIGCYGVCLPYWVVSLEAHSAWQGHSLKKNQYPGQSPEYSSKYVREDGRFGRKYRWSLPARFSSKEHWGLERLHKPIESVLVDWDGFPLDQSMGATPEGVPNIYAGKVPFKFDQSRGVTVAGIQVPESKAIARAKEQVNEFHRRISKTKVGTLNEHRCEIEIVGIQLLHIPMWFVRYAYYPQSAFQFFTSARERRLILSGYTGEVLDGEFPIEEKDRVMTNVYVCTGLAIISLVFSTFFHPIFFILTALFFLVIVISIAKLSSQEKVDAEIVKGAERTEPV